MAKFCLNGSDWRLTGWWTNQWITNASPDYRDEVKAAIPAVPATVPGSVQEDLMRAGLLDDPNYGLDSIRGEWVNNRDWLFDKKFTIPPDKRGERYTLCFEGLDYRGVIFLNGVKLADFFGMFVPAYIDVTGQINPDGENFLRVVFLRSPETDGMYGYSSRNKLLKSRFNYKWDWCPRIVPVGIWEDVYIQSSNYARIADFYPKAVLNGNEGVIDSSVELQADVSGRYIFDYTVMHEAKIVASAQFTNELRAAGQTVHHAIDLGEVMKWWPNTYGAQPLYEVRLTVTRDGVACDSAEKRVGFRNLQMVQNEGAPEGALPYTLMVNGERVYIQGINWVPIKPSYGAVTRGDYVRYLTRFRDMNCNLLRVWGGAVLEKADFYDVCDELGLMVWQEFPQSSSGIDNIPCDDPELLTELEKVAGIYATKRRHYASHIIWCGGNELFWDLAGRPVGDYHPNIAMLKRVSGEMDAGKPFLPVSPSGPTFKARAEDFGKNMHHDVHGPWSFSEVTDYFGFFNHDDALIRTETGAPGAARMEALEKYRGEFPLWPPDERNPLWMHKGSWWIQVDELTRLFGPFSEDQLPMYIMASRYLQAVALSYSAESIRRREPQTSGFIIWMGNEPYPNTANTSLIEYDGVPKPAFYAVQRAFAPVHVSLKFEKISHGVGEAFTAGVYAHMRGEAREAKSVVSVFDVHGNALLEKSFDIRPSGPVCHAGEIQWNVRQSDCDVFFVKIELYAGETILTTQTYSFTIGGKQPFAPLRALPPATYSLSDDFLLKNESGAVMAGVFISGKDPAKFINVEPNFITLMPGEAQRLTVTSIVGDAVAKGDLAVEFLNRLANQ